MNNTLPKCAKAVHFKYCNIQYNVVPNSCMGILCTTLRMHSLSKRCSDVEPHCEEGCQFYFNNRNGANYNSFNAVMQTLTTLEHNS